MECELVSSSHSKKSTGVVDNKSSTPLSYSEAFRKYLPQYMAMGMSPDEYYNGDCTLTIAYRKAYELKQEEVNYHLWLQGFYIYEAVACISPILNPFAKRGTKAIPYLEKPIEIYPKEKPLTQKEKEQEEMEKQKLKFLTMANAINQTMREGYHGRNTS